MVRLQLDPSDCSCRWFEYVFLLHEVCKADYSWMTAGLSECTPFILVARSRPGLPLAIPLSWQAWLVEPGPVCRGPFGQQDRDGGSERVLMLGLSNRCVWWSEGGCSEEKRELWWVMEDWTANRVVMLCGCPHKWLVTFLYLNSKWSTDAKKVTNRMMCLFLWSWGWLCSVSPPVAWTCQLKSKCIGSGQGCL